VCTFPTFQKSTKTAADGKLTTVIDIEDEDVSLAFESSGALQEAMLAALDAVSRAVAKKEEGDQEWCAEVGLEQQDQCC
jgi:hypothetical protein